MQYPLPVRQDLEQLISTLEEKYEILGTLRERVNLALPEVQYQDAQGTLRQYAGLCINLSAQLGQYMRLRRLVLVPYLKDLQEKEEDGHNCRSCGNSCTVQHASHIASIREAHTELRELMEHLLPVTVAIPGSLPDYPQVVRSLRADMMQIEQLLNEALFVEESALIPMMVHLQRNIGAHE